MSPDKVETLRSVRAFAQVFKYLVDERGWPIDADLLDEDDLASLTYDWDPEELGIAPANLQALRRVRQMRPVTASQPWGVFFLEFTGSRLPITQVRRILRGLVTRQRRRGDAGRPSWRLDDLLFIVSTGAAETMELHLIAFAGDSPQAAEFRSLTWRPDSPAGHLRRLATELLPHLDWPEDETDEVSWRAAWRQAFKLPPGQVILDATRLAERMARTARDLRSQIKDALDAEADSGPFSTLMEEIRTQLVSDVNVDRFADMCAQTLTYGLLSSRVTDPEGFGSSPILSAVPLANPFLEAFFEHVHDQAESLDLPGSGLLQLVADLRATNVEAILDQFGSSAKGGDPVIHFYEEFLKRYDSKLRADAGAFYTPQPVVEFMVRMVDEVLRTRFGLPFGIADPATWQEVADRNGFDVPDGIDPDKRFVSMVDPATGTGTFLVEWLRRARESVRAGGEAGNWPDHLRSHVLPSMHAFENMLAPYAIAQLKVALELHAAGAGDGAMQILLTDTLDHRAVQGQFGTMQNPVATEGERAADRKESERFTVVIGNPPYDREQRAADAAGKRKGGVVRFGAPGVPVLLDDITEPMSDAGLGVHIKNLYNDYVYFWRWATWQATELPPGPGVVAFITASSYLDGVSMGSLRALLRKTFDELWIVDLGGEGRGARTDENVFDIRTPVAIAVGVQKGGSASPGEEGTTTASNSEDPAQLAQASICRVRYLRMGGTRADKLAQLGETGLDDVAGEIAEESDDIAGVASTPSRHAESAAGEASRSPTVPPQFGRLTPRSGSAYYEWPGITDLFPWFRSGCKLGRTWPVAEDRSVLKKRWESLVEAVPRDRRELFIETNTGKKIHNRPAPLLSSGTALEPIHQLDIGDAFEGLDRYGYRSFDRQWIIADHRLADRAGPDLWHARGPQQVFLTTLTSTKLGRGPALTVSPYVPDLHYFRGSYGAKDVMPLYRDHDGGIPNLTKALFDSFAKRLGVDLTAEDFVAYVHALAGTAAFAERFDSELAEAAGPIHIPITTDPSLFRRAVELGRDLLWWHTWGERFAPAGQTNLPQGRAQQITPVEGMPEKYGYDAATQCLTVGTGKFGPVNSEVWNFEVSGLKVVNSWLGYRMKKRKGRKSSPLDDVRPTRWTQIDELLRLLAILEHTIEVTPTAAALLDEILASPLIPATKLRKPTSDQRKPLKTP